MNGKLSILPLSLALAAILPAMLAPSCANTTQAPTGGRKDTIPPVLLWTMPGPGSTGIPTEGMKFLFGFDEYVVVKEAKNIFLSPPQKKAPKSFVRGRTVEVTFEEPLDSNTTYTLTFTGALADNNEGNLFPGFPFVFSTGEHIDSMLLTGTVRDCETLQPKAGATVMLYTDQSDSAVFLKRPYAAVKTDDWGFFALPFVGDTLYRVYALEDANADNLYDPETERIAFSDTLVRPALRVVDTIPELQYFDMKDTLNCESRFSQISLLTFKARSSNQYLAHHRRTADRAAGIGFNSRDAWVDSLWIQGYGQEMLITNYNLERDSIDIWVNDRRPVPDTLHLWVNYRKTDSLGILKPELEHLRLFQEGKSKKSRRELTMEDTTCMFKIEATPERVEQDGFTFVFSLPIIYERFDGVNFHYLTPKQNDEKGRFSIERDSLDLRRYVLRPQTKLLPGYEYFVDVPHEAFRDINGSWSDSTKFSVTLPSDETLSTLTLCIKGVGHRYIVDLMDSGRSKVLRSYTIDHDSDLVFPYLKEGSYCIRITSDDNGNSLVDTGDLLKHLQPEKVLFFKLEDGTDLIAITPGTEITQDVDIASVFEI